MNLLLLFRCTTHEYARKFIELGNLRFGTPREWINAAKINNFGRGDVLEGECIAIAKQGITKVDPSPEFIVSEDKNFFFYQKRDVLELRAFCLFGLTELNFTKTARATNRKLSPSGEISNSYFKSFFPDIEETTYEQLDEGQKPTVIIISNPDLFLKRVKEKLISIGFCADEIIMRHVQYVNKYIQHEINAPHPYELFFKDLSYSNQSEFRIVINSKNKKAIEKFEHQNGILEVGNLSDIAQIYDYYFDDLKFMLHDNVWGFSLPKATTYTLTNPIEMMCLIRQALSDEMPGEDSWEDNKRFVDDRLKELNEKHSISFDWSTLKFYNKNGEEIFDASDAIDIICSHVNSFLAQEEYQKAIDSCNLAIKLMPSSEKGYLKLEELCSFFKEHHIKIETLDDQ